MIFRIDDSPDYIFQLTPQLRQSLKISSSNIEDLNNSVSSLIEKVQSTSHLSVELNSEMLSVVREISKLKTVYRMQQASSGDFSEFLSYDLDSENIDGNQGADFVSNITALAHLLVDYHAAQDRIISEVKSKVLEPLTDFQNKIYHSNKNLRKAYDKAVEEFESCLGRYLALPTKKDKYELGLQVYNARCNLIYATESYVKFMNHVSKSKEGFFSEKIFQVVSLLSSSASGEHYLKLLENLKAGFASVPSILEIPPMLNKEQLDFKYRPLLEEYRYHLGLVNINPSRNKNDVNLTKEGYLYRRNKGPLKTWIRKYCWIRNNGLHCFGSTQDNSSLSIDDLKSFTCKEIELDDRNWVFELNNGVSSYLFQAENKVEYYEWINGILNAISWCEPKNTTIPFSEVCELEEKSKRNALYKPFDVAEDDLSSDLSYVSVDDGPVNIITSGFLAIKEIKISKDNFIYNYRKDGNIIWRTCKVELVTNGKLYQLTKVNGIKQAAVLVDIVAEVSSRYYIQAVDESLFNRKYVIVVFCNDGRLLFLAANTSMEASNWLYSLKSKSQAFLPGADNKLFRAFRSVTVKVIEGRSFSQNVDPYCEIYFGIYKKAQTNTRFKSNGEPFWREEFTFDDIHALRQGISIQVMHQSKQNRDYEIGRVNILANSLKIGDTEAWFPVLSSESSNSLGSLPQVEHTGDLKIKVSFEEEIILTLDQYGELLELLTTHSPIYYDIAAVSSDLEYISSVLLLILDGFGKSNQWLSILFHNEIESTDNPAVLFRGNSLLTKAMDCYMKSRCMDYLDSIIGDILRDILEKKVNCEIDPTRLEPKEDIKANFQNLTYYAQSIWRRIRSSASKIPREIKLLFTKAKQHVIKKYALQGNQKVKYTSVTGFLFLRLIVPAILNPKLFQLYKDFADAKTARSLTLIAKTIQCLGNLASFGIKENYMVEMNHFIMENSADLMDFIESVSSEDVNYNVVLQEVRIDLEKEVGTLQRFIRNHCLELKKLSDKHLSTSKESVRTDLTHKLCPPIPENDTEAYYKRRSQLILDLIKASETIEEKIRQKLI